VLQSLEDWKIARLAALTAEDGWLNLIDRLEISEGPQRVGSGQDNDLVLSAGPARLGNLVLTEGGADFHTADGQVHHFQPSAGGFPQLGLADLLLELHSVDGVAALRVRDLTLPRKAHLTYFAPDPAWVKRAEWVELATPKSQQIGQKGAGDVEVKVSHVARFDHQGSQVNLLATHWKGEKPMFVIRDKTSGVETYAASRFLIGEEARDGAITLDFNRAFTPPCGFTDFAICPLPPRENILPFAINAGERFDRSASNHTGL
jgi:uncharacterized protein (DUF1684 family)